VIGAEIIGAIDGQELRKARTRPIYPALDGPHGAIADRSCFLIGKARGAHQNQSLALIGRQFGKCRTEFLELHPAVLLGV